MLDGLEKNSLAKVLGLTPELIAADQLIYFESLEQVADPQHDDPGLDTAMTEPAQGLPLASLSDLPGNNTEVNLAPFLAEPISFLSFEGGSYAGQLHGIDPEGDRIGYGVDGGPDGHLFAVDTLTGELRFLIIPDFFAPGDANGDNVYIVDIGISDGINRTVQTINVTVQDVIIPPPPGPFFDVGANLVTLEDGRTIGFQLVCSSGFVADIDAVGVSGSEADITYQLFGEDAGHYVIDPATGMIELAGAPPCNLHPLTPENLNEFSFDGDLIYEVSILAQDTFGSTAVLEVDFLLFIAA